MDNIEFSEMFENAENAEAVETVENKKTNKKKVIFFIALAVLIIVSGVLGFVLSGNSDKSNIFLAIQPLEIEAQVDENNTISYIIPINSTVKGRVESNKDGTSTLYINRGEDTEHEYVFSDDDPAVIEFDGVTAYRVKEDVILYDSQIESATYIQKNKLVYGEFSDGTQVWVVTANGNAGWVDVSKLSESQKYKSAKSFYELNNLKEYIAQFE